MHGAAALWRPRLYNGGKNLFMQAKCKGAVQAMKDKAKIILSIIVLLTILQLFLFGFRQLVFTFFERNSYYIDSVASMISMVILSILFILFSKMLKVPLSVFPERFHKFYIIGTCAAAILFVTTPSNYTGGFEPIILLIYVSIVTPIFEELIFRGYVWNKLNSITTKEWTPYIVSSILFAVWHVGYIDSIAFRVETGLVNVMFLKVITGLCYGVILGALRLKTKSVYSTMLLHGVMNIFGR
ncbi:MAG: CPBP family intramembrane metalloprotease [Firmicutes bacterium]|nr:CPBP family intramembrane metalloprotease [Bacillota bacterium]